MESSKLTRKFTNNGILNIDKETLEAEIYKESIIGENIKINGGTNYVTRNFDMKACILPSTSYNLARDHFVQSYKLLKYTKNFNKIKRFFLIGFSHMSLKQGIFISAYNNYESNDSKRLFEVDQNVYADLMSCEGLKKIIEKFEINSYSSTVFYEEGGSIREKEEEHFETAEDNEFTFDIHLAFLNHLYESKIKIVPIWININALSNSREIITELGAFLNKYYKNEENFFIYSTNLTYFGKMYHYFGDSSSEDYMKEFKSKSFLRDANNEMKVANHIRNIDDKGINAIKSSDIKSILKLPNFNYCKEILACLVAMIQNENLLTETLAYQIKRLESIDDGFEINMVSYCAIVFYDKF